MGFLNGLRGGQYLGFTTQNVPTIDILSTAPLFQRASGSSGSSGKSSDIDPIDTWEGESYNWNNAMNKASAMQSQGKSLMRKGVMNEDQEMFQQGRSLVTQGNYMQTQLESNRIYLKNTRDAEITRLGQYDSNSIAWQEREGNVAMPVGFTGDANSSLFDPNNYRGGKMYRVSDMEGYHNQYSYDFSYLNDQTGQIDQNVDRIAAGDNSYGVMKGTDSNKEMLQLLQDAKTTYQEQGFVDLSRTEVTTNPNHPLYQSDIWKVTSKNNEIAVETAALLTYNNMSKSGREQQRDMLIETVGENPMMLNSLAAIPMVVTVNDLEKGKTAEDAKALIENNFAKMKEFPAYENGKYELQPIKNQDGTIVGYQSILYPVDPTNPNANETLLSLVTPNTVDTFTAQYVANKANDLKGVYSQNLIDDDLDRYLLKKGADTNINMGNDLVDKMNTLSFAYAGLTEASANNSKKTFIIRNSSIKEPNSNQYANIKLTQFNAGNAYTTSGDIPIPSNGNVYMYGSSAITSTYGNVANVKLKKVDGTAQYMPLSVRVTDVPEYLMKKYNSERWKEELGLYELGLENLIGGNSTAFEQFLKDDSKIIFSDYNDATIKMIDESGLNDTEKDYLKNAIFYLADGKENHYSSAEIRSNILEGKKHDGYKIDITDVGDNVLSLVEDLFNMGGYVRKYREVKSWNDKYGGDIDMTNKYVVQDLKYMTDKSKILLDDNSDEWYEEKGSYVPYFGGVGEVNVANSLDNFMNLEFSIDINHPGANSIFKDIPYSTFSLNELTQLLEFEEDNYEELQKTLDDEDLNSGEKLDSILEYIIDYGENVSEETKQVTLMIDNPFTYIGEGRFESNSLFNASPSEIKSSLGGVHNKQQADIAKTLGSIDKFQDFIITQ